ncbi:glycosyltransferase family 2 protein [candidate division WWE3 bacterium CG06_land_8_20_14_3_00_42_16]|uniref:Glycosyltransferase family 2 protein n=3 Tax=Katanobacteria TaxID=422282 RepID=A0A2M7ALJ0_UNCKA|nr:MAG: glycosyltransferase family 2 protein [candidate division WWE3 bacterium CG06_land_8_20_14_3_00_42_16]PIZ43097.1 MAG: glycosyltransferase family 2 protein [candidate division WWE3 bacterium CG_4_10_14_0_2_um_filter_42_8]PJA37858.1 MAG: glycosyltransferase family 2 protein [candidate division WWE3 bacterium CG_4_9_14_3_um_filter_43_9]
MFPFDKIWVVIPAFNEERTIGQVIDGLKAVGFTKILVVNDGSSDSTESKVKELGEVVLIGHLINRGLGGALVTGFQATLRLGAEWVVTCDADGQHLAADVLRIARILVEEKLDLVVGSRFVEKDRQKKIPLKRKLYNHLGNIVTQILSGAKVTDSQSGLRGFSSQTLEKLDLGSDGMEISSEIIRESFRSQLRYQEVPIKAIYSPYSLSKGQNFAKGIKTLYSLLLGEILR